MQISQHAYIHTCCTFVCMYGYGCDADAEQVQRWGAGAAWWCGGDDDEGRGALRRAHAEGRAGASAIDAGARMAAFGVSVGRD
jgi:hypothetical protein